MTSPKAVPASSVRANGWATDLLAELVLMIPSVADLIKNDSDYHPQRMQATCESLLDNVAKMPQTIGAEG
jgi:hypothetical protein